MKLSLPVIADRLSFPLLEKLPEGASRALNLPRPVFYTNEKRLKADTLYLCKGLELPRKLEFEEGCALICIGTPEKTEAEKPLYNICILEKDVDIFRLSNEINAIYDFFENWENGLHRVSANLDKETALKEFLKLSEDIFEGEIILSDAGETEEMRKVSLNTVEPECVRDICRGKTFLYRLTLKNKRRSDAALLEFLAKKIEHFLKMAAAPLTAENEELACAVAEAIETGKINETVLGSELKKYGLDGETGMRFVFLESGKEKLLHSDLENLRRELAADLETGFTIVYKNSIVALVESESADEETGDTSYALESFTEQHNFRAGVSNDFTDYRDLKVYYRQAMIALNFGLTEKPSGICDFSRYTLDYAFRKIGEEFAPEELYSPVYKRLLEYDRANGTDYLETLAVYLCNNRNAVQTAKDIFIHRATMIYRLKRIMEIGKTELKDERELLHLYMTLFMSGQLEALSGAQEADDADRTEVKEA